jgi:hypothetical protein
MVSSSRASISRMHTELHGMDGMDPAAFGGSAAVFFGAMLLASGIPARRASHPVAHLKDGSGAAGPPSFTVPS